MRKLKVLRFETEESVLEYVNNLTKYVFENTEI